MSERNADELFRDPQEPEEKLPDFIDAPQKTNDPKALAKKAIDDKAKELEMEGDLRAVLSTLQGRRFVARMLTEVCYINEDVFNPNNSVMSHTAGRRQVGITVKNWIRAADFELWVAVDREIEHLRWKPKTSERARQRSRPS